MAAVLKRWFGARTSHDLGNVSRFVNAFGRKTWIPTATTTTVERRTALETTQALTLRKKKRDGQGRFGSDVAFNPSDTLFTK